MASRSAALAGLFAGIVRRRRCDRRRSAGRAHDRRAIRLEHGSADRVPARTTGRLSASVTEAQARARVLAMFNVWENVASASIGYDRAGFISGVGALQRRRREHRSRIQRG